MLAGRPNPPAQLVVRLHAPLQVSEARCRRERSSREGRPRGRRGGTRGHVWRSRAACPHRPDPRPRRHCRCHRILSAAPGRRVGSDPSTGTQTAGQPAHGISGSLSPVCVVGWRRLMSTRASARGCPPMRRPSWSVFRRENRTQEMEVAVLKRASASVGAYPGFLSLEHCLENHPRQPFLVALGGPSVVADQHVGDLGAVEDVERCGGLFLV
jgi:hypothetical protein